MPSKLVAFCTLLVGAGLVAWIANPGRDAATELTLSADTTYEVQSLDAMIQSAGGIVVGKVVEVSPTLWNQDDGSFWEEVSRDSRGRETSDVALPYYTIAIQPQRTLADSVGMDARGPIQATVIGMSPVDGGAVTTTIGEAIVDGGDPHGPQVGQTMVAFLRPTTMAWRDGTRPILQLMGDPGVQLVQGSTPDAYSSTTLAGEPLDLRALEERVTALRGSTGE